MMTIDQYLSEQERRGATFLATIAPVAGESELVRLTPYLAGRCACDHAMALRKQDLELEPTEEMARCCGKELRVFRVHVRHGAQMPAVDHVRYVLKASAPGGAERQSDCARACHDGFNGCVASARSDDEVRWCSEAYSWCLEDCRPQPREMRTRARRGRGSTECNCAAIYAMLADLQEQLAYAPPDRKASLVRRIDRLRDRLESCGC